MYANYKLYTLDYKFIKETSNVPTNFSGILQNVHGSIYWYLNNKLHREDGPAIIYWNNTKMWIRHGELHRLDGYAVESYLDDDNNNEYWILGKKYSKEQYPLLSDLIKLKGLT